MEPQQRAQTPSAADVTSERLAQRIQSLEAMTIRHERLLASGPAATDWERVLDAIEDPICVVTTDYRLIYANTAYAKLFGVDYERLDRHFCFTPASAEGSPGPCVDCPLPRAVRACRASFTQQEWLTPGDAKAGPEMKTYQRWTYPVLDANGTVDRVVEVLKDVTEQEKMRRVIAQEEALREADQLKAELLGTVSHELRSPLTAIKGYAATLLRHERRLAPEERHEFLAAIGEASDRLEAIIDRLLEMSQLATGSSVPQFSPVDIVKIAHEAIDAAEHKIRDAKPQMYTFELRVMGDDGFPARAIPVIQADQRLARIALGNLLENAVKYTPEGGHIAVTICARSGNQQSSPDNAMLEIVVRDTGVGIPDEQLGRVFERFHRVDTRLTREVDGLGLGLAICKRIAELHGGSIWAESAPNEGSAFHLELPVAHEGDSDDEPLCSGARSGPESAETERREMRREYGGEKANGRRG